MAFHTSSNYATKEFSGSYGGPYHTLLDSTVELNTTIKMWEVGIRCWESRADIGGRASLYIQVFGRLTNGTWTGLTGFVTNTTDQWDRDFNWQVSTGTEITAIRYLVKSQDSIARGHNGYVRMWIAKWATNVAPSAPTSVTLHYNQNNDPAIPSTFPENTSQIKVKWGAASDGDGDALKYRVERYIGGALSATLSAGTTALSIVDTIGTGNQGTQYSYRVTAIDPDGATAYRNSSTVTKNRLSAPTGFNTGDTFSFDGTQLVFNWNVATNSNGNSNISYTLDAEGLPVYNHKISSGTKTKTVTVWKTGNQPTDTFVSFEDVKKVVSAYQWQGDVLFKLTATNEYGSSAVVSTRVRIDLRKAPPVPTNFRIENSTSITGVGSFYISGYSNPKLKWNQVTDYLGGAVTYTIQQGSYGAVATNISYNANGIDLRLPDLSAKQTITYTITAQTSFGMSSSASFNQEIHYLKQPRLSIAVQERTSTSVNFSYSAQIDSSLPLKFSIFRWQNGVSGSLVNISVGDSKNPSGTATISGLTEESKGSILFYAKDNSGLTAQTTDTKDYYAYVPVMSVRKKGIGINCVNEESNCKLKINGHTMLENGNLIVKKNGRTGNLITIGEGDASGSGVSFGFGGLTVIGGGESAPLVLENISNEIEHAILSADNEAILYSNLQNGWNNRKSLALNKDGDVLITGVSKAAGFVQYSGNYGTPIEIGKYIDMHQVGSTKDVDVRLEANAQQGIRIQRGDDLSKFIELGVGPTDKYIHNNTAGSYLQLKDNGQLDYSGQVGLNRLGIKDTRGMSGLPNDYQNYQISLDFKETSTIGNTNGGNRASWNNLLTLKGWSSDATGHPISQLAFNGNVIDYRCSNGGNAWRGWKRLPMLGLVNGYWGLSIDMVDDLTYIRAPKSGFLPYTSNGGGVNSVLGTASWQWHEAHIRNLFLGNSNGNVAQFYYNGGNDVILVDKALLPSTNGTRPLGYSNNRWAAVYAANGTVQTSDMRYKSDIKDIDDEIFFNMIKGTGVHSYVLNPERVDVDTPTVMPLTLEDAPQENVQIGILAQEMAQFDGSEYILCYDEESGYSVNNYNLTSAVMAALKVEITKRETLESEVAKLKNDMLAIEQVLISAGLAK